MLYDANSWFNFKWIPKSSRPIRDRNWQYIVKTYFYIWIVTMFESELPLTNHPFTTKFLYIYIYIYTFIYYLDFRPPFVGLGSVSQLPNTLPDCTKSDTKACPVLPYLLNLTNYNVDSSSLEWAHDDVIRWKYFLCNWPFVRGIHRWPVDFPHKDQWRRALEFSLICTWTNGWAINRDAGDSRRHHTHRNIIVMGTEALQWLRSHVFP